MQENNIKDTYDSVPYTSNPFAISSIFRLEAIAKMSGFEPAPHEKCRVLELGCSFGGNLMMSALCCPDSEFIGIDLSSEQIERGSKIVEQMGIKNLKLIQGDISQIATGGAAENLAKSLIISSFMAFIAGCLILSKMLFLKWAKTTLARTD